MRQIKVYLIKNNPVSVIFIVLPRETNLCAGAAQHTLLLRKRVMRHKIEIPKKVGLRYQLILIYYYV